MCAIFAIISANGSELVLKKGSFCGKKGCRSVREIAFSHSGRQRHRGPDHTGVVEAPKDGVVMVQERLAILGVKHGNQPLLSADENLILIANGEIYNYLAISDEISKKRDQIYTPRSDSDVILALYEEHGINLVQHLTGMFAFVLYDKVKKMFVVGRDPFGIIPLYQGVDESGNLYFSSEMKCLVGLCENVSNFTPGKFCWGSGSKMHCEMFFNPSWISHIPNQEVDLRILREKLEYAVRTHLQCEVPFGALLSGGVDSSLIASIATKIKRETDPSFKLKTYSVGLKNAPDFKYSQMVADFIGSEHEEVFFTVQEGLDCIRDIIYHLESYDVTTIRSSIPMFLLSRFIKSEGLKMVLSGEGADEIFGGYLYFHSAPNAVEFHKETVSRVQCLHFSDCLRANKSTMSWGIELRVPFLDTEFVNHAMSIRPVDRMPKKRFITENGNGHSRDQELEDLKCMEKYILRAAFADNYLPDEVLWRQKEQFSDGVGYQWIDKIKNYASYHVTDEEFSQVAQLYPINTPTTKEAFFYRSIFEEMYPSESFAATVMKWIPRTDWGCPEDPSGRAQRVHIAATEK